MLNAEQFEYELFSAIIHRGTAYGGHYHAVVKNLDPNYFGKQGPSAHSGGSESPEAFCYLNLNDTLIKPMTFDMLEKFNGTSDENVYLLIYRRKPLAMNPGPVPKALPEATAEAEEEFLEVDVFNGELPCLKAKIRATNPILREVLESNQKVQVQRNLHKSLESKIRVYFALGEFGEKQIGNLGTATNKFIIDAEEPFQLRNRVVCSDMEQHVVDVSEVSLLGPLTSGKLGLSLDEYSVFEVDVKYDEILHYRHRVDFQMVALQYQSAAPEEHLQIRHNSTLLFLKTTDFPPKFKSFAENFDGSEPVQLLFKYKDAEKKIFCQRNWSLAQVNAFFTREIKGMTLRGEGKEEVRVPGEDFDLRSLYITVNGTLVSLQTMAKTREVSDLIYHNQEVCYVERGTEGAPGDPGQLLIEVIFEKKYDVRTKNFEPEATLTEVFQVKAGLGVISSDREEFLRSGPGLSRPVHQREPRHQQNEEPKPDSARTLRGR